MSDKNSEKDKKNKKKKDNNRSGAAQCEDTAAVCGTTDNSSDNMTDSKSDGTADAAPERMEYVPSERDLEVYAALRRYEACGGDAVRIGDAAGDGTVNNDASDNRPTSGIYVSGNSANGDLTNEGSVKDGAVGGEACDEPTADEMLYCAELDRSPCGMISACRVFVLKESIAVVTYTVRLGRVERIRGSHLPARAMRRFIALLPWERRLPARRIDILSVTYISRGGLGSFRLEELPGGLRLVAEHDGDGIAFARLSLDRRREGDELVRVLSSLADCGELPERGEAEGGEKNICPRCGGEMSGNPPKCSRCARPSSILSRFLVLMKRYRGRMALILLFLVISSVLGVVTPYISSGFYVDEVLTEGGSFFGAVGLVLLLSVGTKLLSAVVSIVSGIVSSRMSADFIYELKKEVFSAFERLSVSFFTGRQTGGLMQMVDGDTETIYWLFGDGLPYLLINLAEVAVVFFIMLSISVPLTLLTVAAIPAAVLLWRLMYKKMRTYNARRFTANRTLQALLSDIFGGMRVVKTFAKEREENSRFDGVSTAQADADLRASVFSATAFPLSGVVLSLSVASAWALGGIYVMRGKLTYGQFYTFITYVGMVHAPVMYFYNMIYALSDSLNAMSRITDILDAEPDVAEAEHPLPMPAPRGEVEFDGVGFSYDGIHRVLEDVSFRVPAGETLGIVGYTGAGKSTLVNLLMRLYDPTVGSIRIDGVPISDVKMSDLREHIAIVSQETYLFVGSIYDNIAYARPEASREEVIRAARLAGAHDFIMRMPDAYQTRIGRGNKELSGGERQRLSIARALLRDPKILIMDEATAAMDTHTERLIQRAISGVTRGRTTIIIAHRLSTLRDADSIIVVDGGRIPERGTHEELLALDGIYAKLYRLQLEALKNIGVEG